MDSFGKKQLAVVDYVFLAGLLAVSLGIGVYSAMKGRGNNTTQEYLLGGRQMSPIPVAISLLGGVISAVSILGLSAEMYFYGTQLSLTLVGCGIGIIIVQQLIVPVLYPLQMVSMNEYMELRYGSSRLRKVSSFCSLMLGFLYMGAYLYAPSLTLSAVTNLSTIASITIIGGICTFYVTIGGVKAVVYTDVVQTILMFGGILAVVIVCSSDLGGVSNVFSIANEGGRLEFFNMSPDPYIRHTFWSVIVLGIFGMISWVGLNQPTFQRFSSVKSLTISKRLATFFLIGIAALWSTFYFAGVVAYATYSHCDPFASGRIQKPDQILPYLVLDKLSHLTGIPGLFVAAVYGGVLSSVSSASNSVACILWEDVLKDLKYFKEFTDVNATRVIKLLSIVAGIIGILLAIAAGYLGNIFHLAVSATNAFAAPCCSLFIAGMCTPWANAKGAYAGVLTSLVFSLWLLVGKFVNGLGSPKSLPVSVEGCPENLLQAINSTFSPFENSSFGYYEDSTYSVTEEDVFTTTLIPDILDEQVEEDVTSVYNISYCYAGMLGLIIGVVVNAIVSLITGPLAPDEVEPRLLSPTCLRIYKYLWTTFKVRRTSTQRQQDEKQDYSLDTEASVPMIIINNYATEKPDNCISGF